MHVFHERQQDGAVPNPPPRFTFAIHP
jgi:hypothetical protein